MSQAPSSARMPYPLRRASTPRRRGVTSAFGVRANLGVVLFAAATACGGDPPSQPRPSAPTTHVLSVVPGGGSGGGIVTITSSAGTVRCTVDAGTTSGGCSQTLPVGSTAQLTHESIGESSFAGWSGACGGTGGCVVTMSADRQVGAAFAGALPADARLTSTEYSLVAYAGDDPPSDVALQVLNVGGGTLGDIRVQSIDFAGAPEWLRPALIGTVALRGVPAALQFDVDQARLPIGTHRATVTVGTSAGTRSLAAVLKVVRGAFILPSATEVRVTMPIACDPPPSGTGPWVNCRRFGDVPEERFVRVRNGGQGLLRNLVVSHAGTPSDLLVPVLNGSQVPASPTAGADLQLTVRIPPTTAGFTTSGLLTLDGSIASGRPISRTVEHRLNLTASNRSATPIPLLVRVVYERVTPCTNPNQCAGAVFTASTTGAGSGVVSTQSLAVPGIRDGVVTVWGLPDNGFVFQRREDQPGSASLVQAVINPTEFGATTLRTDGSPPWLTLSCTPSAAACGQVTATVNTTGLTAAGSPYTSWVRLTSPGTGLLSGALRDSVRVEVHIVPPPRIQVSMTDVVVSGRANGAVQSQPVLVENAGGDVIGGLAVENGGAAWLSGELTATTAPATLTVRANPAGLAPGTHQGTLTVRGTSPGDVATVRVTVVVVP